MISSKASKMNKSKFFLATELVAIASITFLALKPTSVYASCASPLDDGGFEQQTTGSILKPWFREGKAGIDINKGLSFTGRNNAWIRNNKGWNGIRQPVKLTAGSTYTVTARVRTSGNLTDGYFGFRNAQQKPVAEIKFGAMATYNPHSARNGREKQLRNRHREEIVALAGRRKEI